MNYNHPQENFILELSIHIINLVEGFSLFYVPSHSHGILNIRYWYSKLLINNVCGLKEEKFHTKAFSTVQNIRTKVDLLVSGHRMYV